MFHQLIEILAQFIITLIETLGYFGIILAMALESANIPLPSEIIMPFSGFLVSKGEFNLHTVAFSGAVGCLIGSVTSYCLGAFGGEQLVRTLIKKYGKYVLIFEYELDETEEWFVSHGESISFFSRMLPVVRTFISLPLGIAKVNFFKFSLYTFLGSLIWSYPLAYLGMKLGENWNSLGQYFHKFDIIIVATFSILGIWYVSHKIKRHAHYKKAKKT